MAQMPTFFVHLSSILSRLPTRRNDTSKISMALLGAGALNHAINLLVSERTEDVLDRLKMHLVNSHRGADESIFYAYVGCSGIQNIKRRRAGPVKVATYILSGVEGSPSSWEAEKH
jgi:hypothetical protein